MKPFNHNIKFLRKKKGFSQREFAELLGVNRGNIATYEKESNAPDSLKQALAEHFDLNLSKILTEKMTEENYRSFLVDDPPIKPHGMSEPATHGIQSLLELIQQLPESELKELIRMKAIKLIESDLQQKEKLISLHEYKDELLKILKDGGYEFD